MKRYTVAEARARFADVLDHAEAGQPVVIERNGVRFQVTRAAERRRRTATTPLVDILDPAVEHGEWTWAHTSSGEWRFSPRRASKRSR